MSEYLPFRIVVSAPPNHVINIALLNHLPNRNKPALSSLSLDGYQALVDNKLSFRVSSGRRQDLRRQSLINLYNTVAIMSLLSRLITSLGLILLSHAYVTVYYPPLPKPSLSYPPYPHIYSEPEHYKLTTYLIHSGYSAHEHSTLFSKDIPSLPLDIAIETLVGFLLFATGLVLGAEKLKPISWKVWAGQIEREGGGENPFRMYEERPGFWDVRVCGLFLWGESWG